ncbi:MAG: hypothetical protein OXR67_06950 [Chloroflexota bacterium]|nr:hypothetical protein [Chloroflexota bacterium]
MTTPQPARLRPSSPTRYEEISRHLLQQAEEELDNGDVLQASEKIWLAVAHGLKAIAQHRGWNHRYHNHLRAIESFLSLEWNRPDWETTFGSIENMHTNAYEHQRFPGNIRPYLLLATIYSRELADTRHSAPPPGVQLSGEQQATQAINLRTLTRPLSEQAAFGTQFTPEEETELPPVNPTQP